MSYWFYRLLAMLPLRAKFALATLLAWLTRAVLGYRRKTVAENLANSFPEMSAAERNAIAKRFYGNLVDSAMEIVHGHRMPLEEFRRRVKVRNPELPLALTDNGSRSVVVLVIHQGNWEWMLPAVNDLLQIPIDPVYKPLHDQGADRFMYEVRSRFGGEPITAATAAKSILRKRRQSRLIAILADQSPGKRERMHWSPMLNQSTAWFTGAASIARLIKSPVVFAQCLRTDRGHYEVVFHELVRDPRAVEEGDIVDAYARAAEQAIREQPDSYLWSNRRWKLKPDQAPAASSER